MAASPQPATQGGLSILIIEDNPDCRATMSVLLSKLGHRVQTASNGSEGVEKAFTLRPDVALVDIGLPGMDGFEVSGHLKSAFGSSILILACTAYDDLPYRERALRAGFDGYLVKPVNVRELLNTIAENRPWNG